MSHFVNEHADLREPLFNKCAHAADNTAMMAWKRCSSTKLLSLMFVSKSISKSLLIKILVYLVALLTSFGSFINLRVFLSDY